MKKPYILIFVMIVVFGCNGMSQSGKSNDIRLIIRGDDIGSFHAANVGCIESYTDGIMRSVEIMVPCPWYPEAVEMLNQNPGLDVGVHLVMTSEWEAMKWGPVTGKSSITDDRGYFFPMVWANDNFPPERAFRESNWTKEDVEKELRAQIELAKKDIPSLSHVSSHMGFTSADGFIDSLVTALAKEYDLYINTSEHQVKRFRFEKKDDLEGRVNSFIKSLNELEPGTYLFVEHPALDTDEMKTVGHKGYGGVGIDRQMVTDMFTSEKIMKEIERLGIELISYADLVK